MNAPPPSTTDAAGLPPSGVASAAEALGYNPPGLESAAILDPSGKDGSGPLTDAQRIHAKRFYDWLLGLNRADYMTAAAQVLNPLMRAYFKHTVKVHSPPARQEKNDVHGTPSDRPQDPNLPGAEPPAE